MTSQHPAASAHPDPADRRLGRLQEYLKQIVYGGNDGIVTTFAVVAGFAGAKAEGVVGLGALAILVFGLANLFADAVSMGLGEFLSDRSQRDVWLSRKGLIKRAIAADPEGEAALLAGVLHRRGLPAEAARAAADQLMRAPEVGAEMLLSLSDGLNNPHGSGSASRAAVTFAAFVLFGFVPILPYTVLDATPLTFGLSVGATSVALVALGLVRWRATGARPGHALFETVGVGAICAVVAFAMGALVAG